jgi:hypothetical protein
MVTVTIISTVKATYAINWTLSSGVDEHLRWQRSSVATRRVTENSLGSRLMMVKIVQDR